MLRAGEDRQFDGKMISPKPKTETPPEPVNAKPLTPEQTVEAEKLIGLLSDDDFKVRQKASGKLLALGAAVIPVLRKHAKDDDPEVRNRVAALLKKIQEKKSGHEKPSLRGNVAAPKPPMIEGKIRAPAPPR